MPKSRKTMTLEELRGAAEVKAALVAEIAAKYGIPADVALQIINQEMATNGESSPKSYGL